MSRLRLAAFLLILWATAGPAVAQTRPAAPEATTYAGLEALRWTNGTVDLVIVPATGRIMRYGFVNEPNVLWENPDPQAKANRIGGWINYGGDKAWIWPQSAWHKHLGRWWPPPVDNLPEPYESNFDGQRLTLRSPAMGAGKIRLVREIELSPTGTTLRTRTRLENAAPGLMAWQVTQIPVPDEIFVRPAADASQATPIKHAGNAAWTAFREADGLLLLDRVTTAAKAGLDADRLAARIGQVLLIQTMRPAPADASHTAGERAQVFYEPNVNDKTPRLAGPYIELEFTAARRGQTAVDLEVEWTLHRLTATTRPALLVASRTDTP